VGETISSEAGLDQQHSELPFKGERMKKLFTIACTLVLGSALSFAQAAQTPPAGGTTDSKTSTTKTKIGKKGATKAHKGKKAKKASTTDATPAPK
jgi:hypothetical protein